MTSMQSKLERVGEALASLTVYCYHYWRSTPKGVKQYIIWEEDTEGISFHSNNKKVEQSIHGSIDLFTKSEYDPMADRIQMKLNEVVGASWRLLSVQHEEDTGFVHYEWEFNVV